jgi:hypothetical protein
LRLRKATTFDAGSIMLNTPHVARRLAVLVAAQSSVGKSRACEYATKERGAGAPLIFAALSIEAVQRSA